MSRKSFKLHELVVIDGHISLQFHRNSDKLKVDFKVGIFN